MTIIGRLYSLNISGLQLTTTDVCNDLDQHNDFSSLIICYIKLISKCSLCADGAEVFRNMALVERL